jgi:hypothetical protein
VLSEEDAALICNIPISPQRQEDKLVWVGTRNGEFTVKSAYHIAKEKMDRNKGSTSSPDSCTKFWKTIWKVQAPLVVKVFLWKACTNILPTKHNLYKKRITENSLCPLYGLEDETTEHILWNCQSAQDVCVGSMQS